MTPLLDRVAARYPLDPPARLLAMVRAGSRHPWLDRASRACLSVYPDDVLAVDHHRIPWWRRSVARVGVWLHVTGEILACRAEWKERQR